MHWRISSGAVRSGLVRGCSILITCLVPNVGEVEVEGLALVWCDGVATKDAVSRK